MFENIEKLKNSNVYDIKNDTQIVEVCTQNGQSITQNLKDGYFMEWNFDNIKRAHIFEDENFTQFKQYIKNNNGKYCKFFKV